MIGSNVVTLGMWDNSPGIRLPQFIIEMPALKVEVKLNCGGAHFKKGGIFLALKGLYITAQGNALGKF
jgi:hypothetical protein